MAATVVLLHRTPDGREHFDWLFQRPGGGPLIAFRTAERPDRPAPWRMPAKRLPDHRKVYLMYQGPLSGGRGEVRRIAEGRCEVVRDAPDGFLASVHFPDHSGELTGRPGPDSGWQLDFRAIFPPDPAPE